MGPGNRLGKQASDLNRQVPRQRQWNSAAQTKGELTTDRTRRCRSSPLIANFSFSPKDCRFRVDLTTGEGRSRTVTVLKRGRSAAVFKNRRQLPGNGRAHRTLHFSVNSANGGLQSTSVTGPEKRQRRVWVDDRHSPASAERLQLVCDRRLVQRSRPARQVYTSVCSAISSASSTSIPRYLTVLSSLL
jgi:hypothetical protein